MLDLLKRISDWRSELEVARRRYVRADAHLQATRLMRRQFGDEGATLEDIEKARAAFVRALGVYVDVIVKEKVNGQG